MFGNLTKRLFGGSKSSSEVAKSRLSFVLVQDRAGLSPEEMASFREELTDVIEKYFVVDRAGFDISYERSDDSTSLLINSPVLIRREKKSSNSAKGKTDKAAANAAASV